MERTKFYLTLTDMTTGVRLYINYHSITAFTPLFEKGDEKLKTPVGSKVYIEDGEFTVVETPDMIIKRLNREFSLAKEVL